MRARGKVKGKTERRGGGGVGARGDRMREWVEKRE